MNEYLDALAKVETAACMPLVPGETAAWSNSVRVRLDSFRDQRNARRDDYNSIFQDIEKHDPALAHRVATLRKRYEQISGKLAGFGAALVLLQRQTEESEPLAVPIYSAARATREEFLRLLQDCRVLENEIAAWFSESHYRDRGRGN